MAKMFFPQYERGRKEGVDLIIGQSVLEHIRRIGGVEIDSDCGGKGTCGGDIIRVEEGLESLTEMTPQEQNFLDQGVLPPGQRLACQARVAQDVKNIRVFIRNFGRYTILIDTIEIDTELNPCVTIKNERVIYHTGENLGRYQGKLLGLAVDVGTTTLVMQVVDLITGENISNPIASKNPQIAYGNDVISRGGFAMEHEGGL
ncbi:MAG: 2Fe-2S iron-sulfur cluster binding domain-containing protein, partial [Spirochaetes bacterium]|nr:2Fe-2S iron-sulfur cluster binding domain-containing protein [Spirochaetota bacterium]